jgi:hypothetical protein
MPATHHDKQAGKAPRAPDSRPVAEHIDTEDLKLNPTAALGLLLLLLVISYFLPQTLLAWGIFTCVVVVSGLVMFFQPLEREKKRDRR